MKLRPYQDQSVIAIDAAMAAGDMHPLIEIPTGGGKTLVIAGAIAGWMRKWPGTRVIVIAHTRELVRQNAEKMLAYWPGADLGVYCAGLGRKEIAPVTYASIQSAYRKAHQFGHVDVLMVDEAHHIPARAEGTYRRFINALREINPNMRIVGLTATPYRLESGSICGPEHLFDAVTHRVGVMDLIEQGYLCPLVAKATERQMDTRSLRVRAGEFREEDMSLMANLPDVIDGATDEIIDLCGGRRAWLIFCVDIEHAENVAAALARKGVPAGVVHSDLKQVDRDETLARFERGDIVAVCNVNVLSEGYDSPRIDAVCMLRPTLSPGLYYQQCGRGFRIHPDKDNTLVLDFAGNVMRHGPVDNLLPPMRERSDDEKGSGPPVKPCPVCTTYCHIKVRECPECGHQFEFADPHGKSASVLAPLSNGAPLEEWVDVDAVEYHRHGKPGKPDSMRVTYRCGLIKYSEWICPEHNHFSRSKSLHWAAMRGVDIALTAGTNEFLDDAKSGAFREPIRIKVRKQGKFPEIMNYEFERATVHQIA